MNKSYHAFSDNVVKVIKILSSLRSIVHPTKSALNPRRVMKYLGFVMTLTLTHVKSKKLYYFVMKHYQVPILKIGTFASHWENFQVASLLFPSERGVLQSPRSKQN